MTTTTLKPLVGLHVARAYWSEGKRVSCIYLALADGRVARLYPEGECCADAFIQHVSTPEALFNAEILSVEDLSVTPEDKKRAREENPEALVLDVWGHVITTTRGTCVLDCRTDHNGFYAGSLEFSWADKVPEGAKTLEER